MTKRDGDTIVEMCATLEHLAGMYEPDSTTAKDMRKSARALTCTVAAHPFEVFVDDEHLFTHIQRYVQERGERQRQFKGVQT